MISVIQSLTRGETRFVDYFKKAKPFWDDFFRKNANVSDDDLTTAIGHVQMSFEIQVFDLNRAAAKVSMPVTCFAALYDDVEGFGDNRDLAVRVAKAFFASNVSSEVKSYARDAVILYDLDDDDADLKKLVRRS